MSENIALMDTEQPFDALAVDYDRQFTHSLIGSRLRQTVWTILDACFFAGQRIVEFGCGTGEDAVYLGRRGINVLATDVSNEMVRLTKQKVAQANLLESVSVKRFAMEKLYNNRDCFDRELKCRSKIFDGTLINFGALNCIADLTGFAKGLKQCLRPGARGVFCLMGPTVPWEWFWFLIKRQPAKAFRRLSQNEVQWRGLTIRYPSVHMAIKQFSPSFSVQRVTSLGFFLPPVYAESWIKGHPVLLNLLNRLEKICNRIPLFSLFSDHYLLEMKRL